MTAQRAGSELGAGGRSAASGPWGRPGSANRLRIAGALGVADRMTLGIRSSFQDLAVMWWTRHPSLRQCQSGEVDAVHAWIGR